MEEVIEMTVSTDQSDGLLLWHGQRPSVRGRGKDYLSLALHGGKVVFRSVGWKDRVGDSFTATYVASHSRVGVNLLNSVLVFCKFVWHLPGMMQSHIIVIN